MRRRILSSEGQAETTEWVRQFVWPFVPPTRWARILPWSSDAGRLVGTNQPQLPQSPIMAILRVADNPGIERIARRWKLHLTAYETER
jgi:hypothetical protein